VGSYGLDASGSVKGPLVGYCKHSNEPSGSSWMIISFSRRTLLHGVKLVGIHCNNNTSQQMSC
jgi:hypothetical protein